MKSSAFWTNCESHNPENSSLGSFVGTFSDEGSHLDNASDSISFRQQLAQLGRAFINFFAAGKEPIITEIRDRQGQTWWRVDEPWSGKTHWFSSEIEVMVWLDDGQYR